MPSFLLESPDAKLDRIIADCDWRASLPPLTPEERDREIYEAVYIQGRKPAKVAREWNLTPITVQNIARQTRDKLARREHELDKLCKSGSLKEFYDELFDQKRELRESWEASKEGQTTLMLVEDGREPTRETIRNKGIGDIRLMRLIHQISEKMQAIRARFAVEDMERRAGECDELSPSLDFSEANGTEEQRRGGAEEKAPEAIPLPSSPPPLSVPSGEATPPLQESQSGESSPQSKTPKTPSRRRRIGRRRGGLGDAFTSLPEGVSTGSEELDRQLLAAINGLPFPAEPCGCGEGGP